MVSFPCGSYAASAAFADASTGCDCYQSHAEAVNVAYAGRTAAAQMLAHLEDGV